MPNRPSRTSHSRYEAYIKQYKPDRMFSEIEDVVREKRTEWMKALNRTRPKGITNDLDWYHATSAGVCKGAEKLAMAMWRASYKDHEYWVWSKPSLIMSENEAPRVTINWELWDTRKAREKPLYASKRQREDETPVRGVSESWWRAAYDKTGPSRGYGNNYTQSQSREPTRTLRKTKTETQTSRRPQEETWRQAQSQPRDHTRYQSRHC